MQYDRLRRVPAAVLVVVGLAIVIWSGVGLYEELDGSRETYSYDASEAEEVEGRIYQFDELSPGARNLTTAAFQDEITTTSSVPPEFADGNSSEHANESEDEMGPVVDYYVRYQGEFRRLGVSTNGTAVTVLEVSLGPIGSQFYAYSELTDRERTVLDRAIASDSTIDGPNASDLHHFRAERTDGQVRYVVYKDAQAYELWIEHTREQRLGLLLFVPVFTLGAFAVVTGAIGYWLSATTVPTAILLGYVTLFGPPVLTQLGVLAPIAEPQYLLVAAPVVTTVTVFVLGILRALERSSK